MSYSGWTP